MRSRCVSRRLFIAGSARAVAAGGALALAGCSTTSPSKPAAGTPPGGAASGASAAAGAATPDLVDFASTVTALMQDWKVPGAAVAIVKDGQTVFSQAFGKRAVGGDQPVTEQTVFGIGSCTKAFTTLGLAQLVDQGKLDWDGKVRQYLPEFKLKDGVADQLSTLRDLLAHRTGLPGHDYLVLFTVKPQDVIQRLPYLDFSAEFRARFQYGSILYTVAGLAAAKIAGQSWEQLMSERILKPLGMASTRLTLAEQTGAPDLALPHDLIGADASSPTQRPFRNLDAVGPGAAMSSNISDMSRWLGMLASQGKRGSTQLVSQRQFDTMGTAQMPVSGDMVFPEWPSLSGYGLGWYVRPYRGSVVQYHEGSIDGYRANVSFIRDRAAGVVVLSNLSATPFPSVVAFEALDRLLGLDVVPWNDRYKRQWQADLQAKKQAAHGAAAGGKPGRPLQSYTGSFENAGYGGFSVAQDQGALLLKTAAATLRLLPDHGDVFRLESQTAQVDIARATFTAGPDGQAVSVSIPLQEGVPDVVFTRRGPAAGQAGSSLDRLAGTYLASVPMTVQQSAQGSLVLSVPGQAPLELAGGQDSRFTVNGVPNATVEFLNAGSGAPTGLVVNLPSGTLTASRR